MMKKTLLSMAALSAVAIAAPAVAQQYPSGGYPNQSGGYQNQNGFNAGGNIAARIGQLQTRLQAGVQSGAITRQEAVQLRQQLRQLNQLERQYSLNGLSGQERADLQQRIRNLRQQIRYAEGGYQAGYQNDQYDDDYGQDDRYDRVDRDDGYYDRNGRWIENRDYDDDYRDDYDDYDDDYQQPQRGGIGGIIDNVFGGGGLRVGQRAPGNLYGVPSNYRSRFRDGNGVYYRSDGRQIYQIDSRTQTVVRVYPMDR